MLLYIHVPFCKKRCNYCAFYSLPVGENPENQRQVGTYLTTLRHEIALWHERLGQVPVESIFFGGGTPSLLSPKEIGRILNNISKLFTVSNKAEVTIEANPESALARFWLEDTRKAGVNRLSLGVQSLNDKNLQILGRLHTVKEACTAYDLARRANFASVSLDLMWGLPGKARPQQQAEWLKELQIAVNLQPDHISAYGLSIEEDSNLAKQLATKELLMGGEKVQAQMFLHGAEFLESAGLLQYEISNFAKLGFACKHNMGYWQGENYLGFGPSATSTLGNCRWTNPANLMAWQNAVKNKSIGTETANPIEKLDQHTKNKEKLMLAMRTTKGLDLPDWQKTTGEIFCKSYKNLVDLLVKNNLASIRKDSFRLTRSGMLVSSTIIEHFFRHIDEKVIQK